MNEPAARYTITRFERTGMLIRNRQLFLGCGALLAFLVFATACVFVVVRSRDKSPVDAVDTESPVSVRVGLSAPSAELFTALGVTSDTETDIRCGGEPNLARVKRALARGADVNAVTRSGYTPLMIAAMRSSDQCISALIAQHAELNRHGPSGTTALSLAAQYGSTAAVKALVNGGANINESETAQITPLMRSVIRGDVPKVRFLVAAGANIKMKDADGHTALDWARRTTSRSPAIEEILKRAGG